MRIRNVELLWSPLNRKHELVKWQKCNGNDSCYVIAFFDKTRDGYDMRTVDDRFFEDHDAWIVGKHAIAFLKDAFEEEED